MRSVTLTLARRMEMISIEERAIGGRSDGRRYAGNRVFRQGAFGASTSTRVLLGVAVTPAKAGVQGDVSRMDTGFRLSPE